MNYYCVTAKCGHVGNRRYVLINFPVKACSAHEASQSVLYYPKVKGCKDAIHGVEQISLDKYLDLHRLNAENAYLHAHTKNEIRYLLDSEYVFVNENHKRYKNKKEFDSRYERVAYLSKKRRERNYCYGMDD